MAANLEALIALLEPAVDALLRPWRRPDDLLAALAGNIADGGGAYGIVGGLTLTEPEQSQVVAKINDALSRAVTAYFNTQPPPADARHFIARCIALEAATMPLTAPHFHGRGRLAVLLLGTDGDSTAGADIRLLSARKLVEHIDSGGKMEIRQALEAADKDVFLDAATIRTILPELETKDVSRCTFSGVVALSYAWVTPENPDPQRAQLLGLRPVLVW